MLSRGLECTVLIIELAGKQDLPDDGTWPVVVAMVVHNGGPEMLICVIGHAVLHWAY